MTRRKRRKIAAIIRVGVLLILPAVTAAGAKGISEIGNIFSEAADLSAEKKPTSSVSTEKKGQSPYSSNFIADPEDILSGSIILSKGYGISEETAEKSSVVNLPSPLEMISDNPGEKPYPAENEWTAGGSIVRTTYGKYSNGSVFDLEKGGQVNNKTTVPNETLIKESNYLPHFTISDTSEPQVLLYHTHTTESFEPYVRENYDANFNYRTTDETKNMLMVGDAIQAELEAQGIGVIHVRTIHDYPSYNGSYARSRESILPVLEQYPSIKVALDIHRDAISGEGIAYQPYIEINGKEAAQIMIISGCDDGTLGMPEYMKNFHFASNLQQKLESDNPGFTRPILFDYRHYNQDLTTGSLLIEVGSHGNTLEQAQYAGQLFGRSLGELLNSMKK